MTERIDLDANATTPMLAPVLEAMLPWMGSSGANPSSAHQGGQRARAAVEAARTRFAKFLGAAAKEIVFTSGGTEADNLALSGVLAPFAERGEPVHLVTSAIEHHAVLFAAEAWEKLGISVSFVRPDRDGVVSAEAVAAELRPETRLVSIMLANNETGAIQPVGKIARLVKAHGALMHTDAVQAAGKLPLDLAGEFKNVDLLAISGHKMYAAQGTGVLFVRSGTTLRPTQLGGPQERQRRAGTENVAGIVGLGKAAELASEWLATSVQELGELRDRLELGVLEAVPGARIHASTALRVCNTANILFPGIDAESLLIALDMVGVATSFGSACMSGATEPSHVLLAMGVDAASARSSLRFSLSRLTTADEIERTIRIVTAAVRRLRG